MNRTNESFTVPPVKELNAMHDTVVLLMEYPYVVKSNSHSIDPFLMIVDSDWPDLRINILQIKQPLLAQDVCDNLIVSPKDDHVKWRQRITDDDELETYRYYAAVKVPSKSTNFKKLIDSLHHHSSAVLNIKPTTLKPKLSIGSFTKCSNRDDSSAIRWMNRITLAGKYNRGSCTKLGEEPSGDFTLCIVSNVPAVSLASSSQYLDNVPRHPDPFKSWSSLNVYGVPVYVQKFTERCRNPLMCTMYNHPEADTVYLAPFFEVLRKQCFDSVYLIDDCDNFEHVHGNKWVYRDEQRAPYTLLLSKRAITTRPPKKNTGETIILDTSQCLDSYIATFHKLKFYNIHIDSFGMYAKDDMDNIMWVGVIDTVFEL